MGGVKISPHNLRGVNQQAKPALGTQEDFPK